MEKEGIPAHLILLIKNWRRKPLPREASATGPTEPWNRSRPYGAICREHCARVTLPCRYDWRERVIYCRHSIF